MHKTCLLSPVFIAFCIIFVTILTVVLIFSWILGSHCAWQYGKKGFTVFFNSRRLCRGLGLGANKRIFSCMILRRRRDGPMRLKCYFRLSAKSDCLRHVMRPNIVRLKPDRESHADMPPNLRLAASTGYEDPSVPRLKRRGGLAFSTTSYDFTMRKTDENKIQSR
jgi:hypothetical protein